MLVRAWLFLSVAFPLWLIGKNFHGNSFLKTLNIQTNKVSLSGINLILSEVMSLNKCFFFTVTWNAVRLHVLQGENCNIFGNTFFRIYLNAEHVAYWNRFVVAQNVQGSVTKAMTASKYCTLFLIMKLIFCRFVCLLIVNFFPWLKCSGI